MHRFSATTESETIVAADREAIWSALTDPVLLTALTPLLRHIEVHDDLWRWELARFAVLGLAVDPSFTERMRFTPGHRIDYNHEPAKGVVEHAGADGWYALGEVQRGTHLAISLTLHVELPLSRLAAPAVERVMRAAMDQTGSAFARNLERHLGLR